MDLFTIGDVIRKLRKRQRPKLGIIALAKRAGINKATLSKIENNKGKFGFETVEKIARGLNVSVSELESYLGKPAQVTASGLCGDPEHARLQVMLDEVLHSESSYIVADQEILVRDGITINVISHHRAASSPPPEGQHGPLDVTSATRRPQDTWERRKGRKRAK